MALDVSTLSLRVDSAGTITQAASDLNKFSNAAEKAETRTTSLLASISKLTSVFAANSASAQAFSSTMVSTASDTSSKVTSTEADQWDKLTRQYEVYQSKRISEAEKYFQQENSRLEAQYQKQLKAQEAADNKSLAEESAYLKKQNMLNAQYAAISQSAQLNTLKRAMNYGAAGEDVKDRFGSTVAALANAESISKLGKEMEAAAKSAHTFSLANAGVTKEAVTMLGELQRGNFSRFDGSLMVMANRMNLLQTLIAKFGVEGILAFAGYAAAAIAVITVITAGEREQNAFNKAVILTGNYVGATRGELQQMAEAASKSSGTIGATKDVMLQLASSGSFTKDEIGKIAPVISNFSLVTGEAIGTVVADFEKLAKEPTKGIVELNNKYNFLTGAIYSQIAALEQQGDTQAAASLAEKTYSAAMAQRTEDILKHQGSIIRGWAEIKKLASEAWDAMINYGSSSDKQELESVNARLKIVTALVEKQKALNQPGQIVDEGALVEYKNLLSRKKVLDAEFSKADTDSLQAQLARQSVAARERDEQDRLHNRTRAEIRKEEIAKDIEDFNSMNAESLGLQLTAQGKSNTVLKEFIQQTDNVTLKAGQERIDYENEKSKKLLKIAQDNGLTLVKTEEDLQARIASIDTRHPDKRGSSPDQTALEITLEKLKGDFDVEKKLYEDNVKDVTELEKTGQISTAEFLSKATTEREIYRVEENAFYDASIKALQNYAKSHQKEAAKIGLDIQKLADERKTANAAIDASEKGDTRTADEAEMQHQKDMVKLLQTEGDTQVATYQKTLNAMQKHLDMLGKTKVEQEQLTQAEAAALIVKKQAEIDSATFDAGLSTTSKLQQAIDNQIIQNDQNDLAMLEKIQAVAANTAPLQAQLDLEKLHTQEIEKGVQAAKDFEKVMTDAFGNIGKAIGQATVAFASFQKKSLDVEKQRKTALDAENDGQKRKAINNSADLAQMSNQFEMYGQIAGAAQNYFDEGSRGYKAMQDVQAAFQLASIAASLASFAAAAPAAIAKAGAQTGWVGAIAMAGLMAALGFAASGGFDSNSGDSTSAADRQAKQGTGTVLGDVTAKSNSIANSMELVSKNSSIGLEYSSEMLAALNSINSAMTGVASAIAQTAGITTGNSFGIQEGTLSKNTGDPGANGLSDFFNGGVGPTTKIGGDQFDKINASIDKAIPILGALHGLWGKIDQSITDSGVALNGSLGNLASGGGMSQYANVATTKSSFFGLVKNTNNSTQQQAMNAELQQQFSLIFSGLDKAMKATASALGVNSTALSQQIDNFNLNIGKVSLKGLTGQALTDALNNVISAAADRLATGVLPGLDAFQKAGEGYFQTAVRVANATEAAGADLYQLGLKAIDYTNIINKQGDVETEIVRQTISMDAYTKSLVGVKDIVDSFNGSASDLAKTYSQLLQISSAMTNANLSGTNLSVSTIQGAGDLSTLASGIKDFQSNFFSQEDQVKMETEDMAAQFVKLGQVMPTTRDGFQQLVRGINDSTASGQKLIGGLLSLSGSFSKVLDDAKALQQSNVDSLNSQASTLQTTEDALKSFQSSLKQFTDSLVLGSDSILTPLQKLNAAQDQYQTTLAAAKAGDTTAQGNLQNTASAYLSASRTANASSGAYTDTFSKVQSDLADVINSTGGKISDTQTQINALNSQVSLLTQINSASSTISINTSSLNSYAQQSFDAIAAQANSQAENTAAINAMAAQLAQLRQEQFMQTTDLIGATITSNNQNAQQIVNGVNQATRQAAWANGQSQPVT